LPDSFRRRLPSRIDALDQDLRSLRVVRIDSSPLRHFYLTLAYDGSAFEGWQRQKRTPRTVQGLLETVLERILVQKVAVRGAGRTDSGVHALGQRAAFSARSRIPCAGLQRALNSLLPETVRAIEAGECDGPVEPLKITDRKTYFYQVHVGTILPPHRRPYFALGGPFLDVGAMRSAAVILQGNHDFSAFVSAAPGRRSSTRNLMRIRVQRIKNGVRLFFTGSGFLYRMVRTLSAALIEVGRRNWTLERLQQALRSRDRSKGPATAPAQGLFLYRVDWHLPRRTARPSSARQSLLPSSTREGDS